MWNGKTLFIDPEVHDIMDRVQNGDPTAGWEGDPAIALFRSEGRWELARLGHDGEYHTICRSRPGLVLDGSLITYLVANDLRRKTAAKQIEETDALNEAVRRARDDVLEGQMSEALQKVYFGLSKDIGYHY